MIHIGTVIRESSFRGRTPTNTEMISIKYVLTISLVFLIFGCATPVKSRPASEYLLTTDKPTAAVLQGIQQKLEENKYVIKKVDEVTGILLTAPRKYSFTRNGQKISARQTIQIRQEGGSVKLRILYECSYTGVTYEKCQQDDRDSNSKISKIEPSLVNLFRSILMKHGDDAGMPEPAAAAEAVDATK